VKRVRAHVLKVKKKHHPRAFWISVGIIGAAVVTLLVFVYMERHDSVLYHLAVGVIVERLAGLHMGGGEG
jgi:hypothetical protein